MVCPNPTFVLFSLLLPTCLAIASLKVETTIGSVYGFLNSSTPHVAQFLGIPFAEPPLGSLRWLPPVRKARQYEAIKVTKFGPSCPQINFPNPSLYTVDASDFLISGPTSEDCLTVNIWTPWDENEKDAPVNGGLLPVIVWIYGGSFQQGGGETQYQIPSKWIERTKSHIVVGINYRLNIFGFPNAGGLNLEEQNLGLLDQRLALEWIRANIVSFGGDSSKITLWGQSAGAMSVDYYNLAYPTDPIVSGLIMDSGTALLPVGNDAPQTTNFTFVASSFGCGGLTFTGELACMRNVSQERIESFLLGYNVNGTTPALAFYPVNDERTKFFNATARVLAGNFTKLPAIIGTNTDEGVSIAPWNPNGADVNVANYVTLDAFVCPAVQTTQNRYARQAPTYRYLYAGNFSNISPRPWEGTYHSSELPMIFGTSDIAHGPSTDFELALSREMQDFWLVFMNDPVNGLVGKGWQMYSPNGTAVEFGKAGVLVGGIPESSFDDLCIGSVAKDGALPPS